MTPDVERKLLTTLSALVERLDRLFSEKERSGDSSILNTVREPDAGAAPIPLAETPAVPTPASFESPPPSLVPEDGRILAGPGTSFEYMAKTPEWSDLPTPAPTVTFESQQPAPPRTEHLDRPPEPMQFDAPPSMILEANVPTPKQMEPPSQPPPQFIPPARIEPPQPFAHPSGPMTVDTITDHARAERTQLEELSDRSALEDTLNHLRDYYGYQAQGMRRQGDYNRQAAYDMRNTYNEVDFQTSALERGRNTLTDTNL